jgi:hypothetical protein
LLGSGGRQKENGAASHPDRSQSRLREG